MKHYNPEEIEFKWLKRWEKQGPSEAKDFDKKSKCFAMVEFPYPSGEGLHIGYAFTNVIMDVFTWKKRAEGFNVLHPMGWVGMPLVCPPRTTLLKPVFIRP